LYEKINFMTTEKDLRKIIHFQHTHIGISESYLPGDPARTQIRAHRSPAVRLIIPTEKGILCNKEYRVSVDERRLCLPGGKIFESWSEYQKIREDKKFVLAEAMDAGIREAHEEQGLIVQSQHIDFLCMSENGITMEWDIYFFVVNKFFQAEKMLQEDEDIKRQIVPWSQVALYALEQKIEDDRCCRAILQYLYKRNVLQV
jgi:hypothetical protein